jgi:hypothetical protein
VINSRCYRQNDEKSEVGHKQQHKAWRWRQTDSFRSKERSSPDINALDEELTWAGGGSSISFHSQAAAAALKISHSGCLFDPLSSRPSFVCSTRMEQAGDSDEGRGSDLMSWTWIVVESDSGGDSAEGADFDIGSMGGPVMTAKISGIVGLCLTSFLWIIVSWRLFYHYSSWCSNCWHYRVDGLTVKRILHGMLWTTMVVEGVAYGVMVGTNSSNKLTYTLLDIIGRGILEYWTFIIGTAHWFNVIFQARSGDKQSALMLYPVILAIMTLGVTVASIFEAVDLFSGVYSTVDEFRQNSQIYRIA